MLDEIKPPSGARKEELGVRIKASLWAAAVKDWNMERTTKIESLEWGVEYHYWNQGSVDSNISQRDLVAHEEDMGENSFVQLAQFGHLCFIKTRRSIAKLFLQKEQPLFNLKEKKVLFSQPQEKKRDKFKISSHLFLLLIVGSYKGFSLLLLFGNILCSLLASDHAFLSAQNWQLH